MRDNIDRFFNFNKGQRRAVFILLTFIFILSIVRYNIVSHADTSLVSESLKRKVDSFFVSADTVIHKKTNKKFKKRKKRKQQKISPHPFDPNTASVDELISVGLTEKQAFTIRKYIKKGGSFKYREDLKKIYCITDNDFKKLEPYILLDTIPKPVQKDTVEKIIVVELNSAGIDELLDIRGIGPYIAKNIIKYRSLLGGYYSVSQLKEVYGIDSLKFLQINNYFTVNPDSLERIDINHSNFYKLKRHPYISKIQAFEIVNYIKYTGKFKKIEDLKSLNSINDSDYQRIYHYFVIRK